MDRKIIGVMVALVAILIIVMVVVMAVGSGIGARAGGFTKLFDQLENTDAKTHDQDLRAPTTWHAGDVKTVSDRIVSMYYDHSTEFGLTVYRTTLYFVYEGQKWNDPTQGTAFTVPQNVTDIHVQEGLFYVRVSSATNLIEIYDVGDVIKLENKLVMSSSGFPIFGTWLVAGTI